MTPSPLPVRDHRAGVRPPEHDARLMLPICALVAVVALAGHPAGWTPAPDAATLSLARVFEALIIALSAWGSW